MSGNLVQNVSLLVKIGNLTFFKGMGKNIFERGANAT